jgi:uncharacterized protein (TIGR02996 family)/excisionase family DNA binding protein
MTTTGDRGLLQAIVERPDDDLTRRVYADWLEENGWPERAEFIRLQLDLARAPECHHSGRRAGCPVCEGRQREEEFLAAHAAGWLTAELPGPGWEWRRSADWMPPDERRVGRCLAFYSRGLVEALFLPMDDFLRCAEQLSAQPLPLRRIQLTDRQPRPGPDDCFCWSNQGADEGHSFHVPFELASYLPRSPHGNFGGDSWLSEAEAVAALSFACVAYLRRLDRGALRRMVFTTGQVAKICQVAPRTVSKWFDSGKLRGYRIPGSQNRRIPRVNLIRFLKENNMPLGTLTPSWEEGAVWTTPAGGTEEEEPAPSGEQSSPIPPRRERRERTRRRSYDTEEPLRQENWQEWYRQACLRLVSNDDFSTGEIALLVKVAPRTVCKWIDTGKLPALRVGRSQQRKVAREELIRFLSEYGIPVSGLVEAHSG